MEQFYNEQIAGPSRLPVPATHQVPAGPQYTYASISMPQANGQAESSSSAVYAPAATTAAAEEYSPSENGEVEPGLDGSGPFVEPHQDLNDFLETFWTRQMAIVERETPDFKTYSLPLARIKKVMKSDEEVRMISAEVPIMFSKACEVFISELTCRAWLIAESLKRRTLQKTDVANAIAYSDMFDFLIDIVPRDDSASGASAVGGAGGAVPEVEGDVEGEGEGEGEDEEGERAFEEFVRDEER